ncbi:bifunctional 4-hydroxy-2-oxoglutarate aldolase/2-dehydro-3-deoxy-phosphogluconate aldolase [Pseudoalteromonas sp. SSMSWG5]|jgi:2-dehydro-3-deoxyphosphogluconate aldolase/(4S)-4-hydroxy-2-oxoglutarate aldolase|uniref:2-dehydro-3-deoxy-phosphogluconate aldolase n=1 Tax=Pseudoalteromonas gelatinilytica TaxID=1703256 RepID=A0A3A3F6F2_9GAMM|nr:MULTISPECIES: bifunctional 4-hydroxy-2-oxoglutarate aldolase/2-dehydro-3-deoxy-phosphogluconate aldolase [Pseudoalteromonas]MBD55646.1 keto-deoxy-phosphogluconate aldolase [Pseudoalteromonas sp.]MBN4057681.1 bifunctional 4-hydroxy-2-oxoglutarate aldolase/2-dehydro-3-deoxy-phosphogluconate aldolase [Pseudoalteromonas haloplanktis]MCF2902952.1 bifunctional 4-hydroxy-2-oxoglutarate aldolase/2-dehydro-3-deoxy-phosphogluconate aldolase [Pseudoalteromonas sp. OFAV1]MCO7249223.1 bifunctional 4-hydr|tara:strand:- start:636 stop:1256 length:621 start_codon:yes stop_codon:yes gene_type:complete
MSIEKILSSAPVVPVVVIEKLEDAAPLARALYNGGLKALEITLRTPIAAEAVKLMKEAVPEAYVGTGTVIDKATFNASVEAGADFMVSPGVNDELLALAKESDIPFLPGAATPSEVMKLASQGFKFLKFFPAEAAGGTAMLKSIGGPLPQVTFCPTGGISLETAPNYLALKNVICVGGTWMLDKQLIENKDWQAIEALARQASEVK